MDGSRVLNSAPSEQEMSMAYSRYFLPYQYHPQVVGSIHPSATSFMGQANGTKKSKLSTEGYGQPRNRWRAHKKETCRCAVCKQVRGELSSTWFKHDKPNCKCSVCRQARGERRSVMKNAPAEQISKTSLISNRVRRLAGKPKVLSSQSSLVLPEENLPCSVLSGRSELINLQSEQFSTQSTNLNLCVISNQSYLDGARVNRVDGRSTLGSDSGLPEQIFLPSSDFSGGSEWINMPSAQFSTESLNLNLGDLSNQSYLEGARVNHVDRAPTFGSDSGLPEQCFSPSSVLSSSSEWTNLPSADFLTQFSNLNLGVLSNQSYLDGARVNRFDGTSTLGSDSGLPEQSFLPRSVLSGGSEWINLPSDEFSTESSNLNLGVLGNQSYLDGARLNRRDGASTLESDSGPPEQSFLPSSVLSGGSEWINLPSDEFSTESSNLNLGVLGNQSYLDGARLNRVDGSSTLGSDSGLPEQSFLPSSVLFGGSEWINLPSDEFSTESSNLNLGVLGNQSYLDGTRVNRVCGVSTLGSGSGIVEESLTDMIHTSTEYKEADSRFSLGAKHLRSKESLEQLPNITSCLPSCQLNSDRLLSSSKCKFSLVMSKSENLCHSPSQALDAPSFTKLAAFTLPSKNAHSSFNDSASGSSGLTSVVPSNQSDMNETGLCSSSVASTSETNSGITGEFSHCIIDESTTSNPANFIVNLEGPHSSSEEPSTESSSKTAIVSSSQVSAEQTMFGWSGGPQLFDTQSSEYNSANKSGDLALPLVSTVPHITLQRASTRNSRKRNPTCTLDSNSCECSGCMGNTFTTLLFGSKTTYPRCTSSTLKRRRIFRLSTDCTRLWHEALHGVGLLSCKNIMASQNNAIITKPSSKRVLLKQRDTNGRAHSSASMCEESSLSSGSFSSHTTSRLKDDSSQLRIEYFFRCRQIVLASSHTLGTWAVITPEFLLEHAGQKPTRRQFLLASPQHFGSWGENSSMFLLEHAGTLKGGRDLYRNLLTVEELGRNLLGNFKVSGWATCGGHSASGSYEYRRYPHQALSSGVEMTSQKSADIRTHRSQSALLLGEEPCSLLRVVHVDLPRKHNLRKLIRIDGVSPSRPFQKAINFDFVLYSRSSPPVRSFYLSLESSLSSHQARPFHDIFFDIYSQDTGNRRLFLSLSNLLVSLYKQTFQRYLLNTFCTRSSNGSFTSPSAWRGESVSSSFPKTILDNTECCRDTAVMSIEAFRPLRVKGITSSTQHRAIKQNRYGEKRKHQGFDGAVQPLLKQTKFSRSETELSAVSSSICRWIPVILGDGSASAILGSSKQGLLLLSGSKSPGEVVTTCQSNLSSDNGKFLFREAEKPEDDLPRQVERANEDSMYSRSNNFGISAVTQISDSPCQIRAKRLSSEVVSRTGEIQEGRNEGTEETSRPDQCSAQSSGLSFQELLNSVSQNSTISLMTGSSLERLSIQTLHKYGEESRARDTSYKELRSPSLNGDIPRMEDVSENNHQDRNLTRDISRLSYVPPMDCYSPGSKRMEDTLPRDSSGFYDDYSSTGERCTILLGMDLQEGVPLEVVALSSGVQEHVSQDETTLTENSAEQSCSDEAIVSSLELPTPSLPCSQDQFAADRGCTEGLDTTEFSISEQLDFDDIQVFQTNMLIEHEKTEFQEKLNMVLEKPFDTRELEELENYVSVRKPQMRLRESRHETRHVALTKEGFSYLEHYPDFWRKLESTSVPYDKLKLLRGFLFWIQHTCMSGAFMPWEDNEEDDECVQIIEKNCTAIRRSSADCSNQIKEMKGLGRQGVAKTRETGPTSTMHMSLRARKKTVYTSKPLRAKKTAEQLASTKVKTEEKSYTFLVTSKRRTSTKKQKKKRSKEKRRLESRTSTGTREHVQIFSLRD